MINIIWFLFIAIGIVVGALTGNIEAVTDAAINSARTAVDISLGLIAVMALWLGIMKIAEVSGLIKVIAKALRFIMVPLFPEVPEDHPAMGAMVMNIAANVLGLGNAATPLGLKAMQELQEINPHKDTASNAMCTFLAINTSSVTLIPATVIAIRAAAESTNPTEIIGPTIIATAASTIAAVIAVKLLQKLPVFQIKIEKASNH
ncbi:nucleoside recognition domain-containing protein [Clostridium formicaceticum]|uniref:Nucleoside recognition protein n=1 Tax=Clostridium formicaceticum TaxID=1497 RepID=A0AAC9RQ79_9CLOT|nr:nucleoside recognition domain-containing protein [Clostridium formicaceticum]AOY75047.1 nucleoside recognition protein [Clostridium formicaceticum]ARE89467.1 Spore maturation protein A [Clostridium formicaceticum]